MNSISFGSTLFSFLMAFALLWAASGHMHDVITSLASTPDGEWLFVRSRFWLLRSQDKGNSWTPLRNPGAIFWEGQPGGPPNFILSPDFKNDATLLFGWNLSTDAGETWSTNLKENLTSRKRRGFKYEICTSDPNPVVFSANFANDKTIYIVARQQENPNLASLFFSKDLGETFRFVKSPLDEFEIDSRCPVLTATTDEIYLHKVVGGKSDIFTPTSGQPKKWERKFSRNEFHIQSIGEDHSSDGILVIERNSQTLYRLKLVGFSLNELIPIKLPSATTQKSGDQLLISAYSHKGEGTKSSLFVLRSTCPGRRNQLRLFGVECPSDPDIEDKKQKDYVLLSTDEGTTWERLTINDWFSLQGGGKSIEFGLPEFSHVLGIPGSPTVFLGTFTGLYRSEDHGESWEELDTIALDVIGMNAAKISPDNAQLSVCTYDASCWTGAIDIGRLRDKSLLRLPEGSLEQVVREDFREVERFNPSDIFAYNTIAFSDGIGFLSDKLGVMRYADGFNGASDRVDSIGFIKNSNVHGIRFSPDFENDDTVFIAGFQLGVFRSFDRGITFENVFNATTQSEVPIGSDSVQLILSPDFASDGVLFTYVTDGSVNKTDGLLFISEDSGSTWAAVDQGENPPRMISLALAIDNSDKIIVEYSMVGLQEDGSVWVSRRKGKDNQFSQWERLRFYDKVKDELSLVLPVAREGFCHDSLLGTPNGNLYLSMREGGIVYGKLVGTKFKNRQTSGLTQRFRFGGRSEFLLKNFRRTFFEGMVEIEGVFFGAFFNEIWMSLDDGSTWTSIYKLAAREPRFAGNN